MATYLARLSSHFLALPQARHHRIRRASDVPSSFGCPNSGCFSFEFTSFFKHFPQQFVHRIWLHHIPNFQEFQLILKFLPFHAYYCFLFRMEHRMAQNMTKSISKYPQPMLLYNTNEKFCKMLQINYRKLNKPMLYHTLFSYLYMQLNPTKSSAMAASVFTLSEKCKV